MKDPTQLEERPLWLIISVGAAVILVLAGGAIWFGFRVLSGRTAQAHPPYLPQTACDHPYLPLREGAVWRYRGETTADENPPLPTQVTWRVTDISGNQDRATAVVIVEYDYDNGGFLVLETVEYGCSAAGIRQNSSITAMGSHTFNQFVNQEGVYLPAQEEMETKGASWRNLYTVITNYEPPGIEFEWEFEVTGFEILAEPELPVETVIVEGIRDPIAEGLEFTTIEWYAYGIGQVRSQRIQQEGERAIISDLTLVQMTLP